MAMFIDADEGRSVSQTENHVLETGQWIGPTPDVIRPGLISGAGIELGDWHEVDQVDVPAGVDVGESVAAGRVLGRWGIRSSAVEFLIVAVSDGSEQWDAKRQEREIEPADRESPGGSHETNGGHSHARVSSIRASSSVGCLLGRQQGEAMALDVADRLARDVCIGRSCVEETSCFFHWAVRWAAMGERLAYQIE
jgi:hypothetical protein